MQEIIEFLRVREWFASKSALMIGIFLYCYIKSSDLNINRFSINLICYLIFISLFLAFGYVVNDFFDRDIDFQAGKKKVILLLPNWVCILILIAMIAGASGPILVIAGWKRKLVCAVLLTILLGFYYSAPPLRFKERGVLGLIVSSTAQRCMPLWVLYEFIPMNMQDFILWEVLSFFIGIRYILIHQRIDAQNDLKTGTITFATKYIHVVSIGIYLSFAMEIICLILLFAPWKNKIVLLLAAILFGYLLWQGFVIRKKFSENMFLTFSCVPLEDFYSFYLPVACLLILSIQYWKIVFFLLVFLLIMWDSQLKKWKLIFFNI